MIEIGRTLRTVREAKGISFETVEDDTKIRRKYIEALEEGRFADTPGEVYLKGFLRTYGNYLGLDGTSLVVEYKASKNPPIAASAMEPDHSASQPEGEALSGVRSPGQSPEGVSFPQDRPLLGSANAPFPERVVRSGFGTWRGVGRIIGLALGILILVGLVALLGSVLAGLYWQQVEPPASQEPVSQSPVPVPKPAVLEPTPTPSLPEPKRVVMSRGSGDDRFFAVPAKEVQLRLEVGEERVWMQAVVDNKEVYQGVSTGSKDFQGKEITIRMGHMNDIDLVINGERLERPLENGPYTLIFKSE